MQRSLRMKKELEMLQKSPPQGASCWPKDGDITHLEADVIGAVNSPYEGGVFTLDIVIPERYPFEPPKVKFVTPIYHPNIDTSGRICLDLLKMPPQGSWKPSVNISTILTSLQILMTDPNPSDPLMVPIAQQLQKDRRAFEKAAREHTRKHAQMKTVREEMYADRDKISHLES